VGTARIIGRQAKAIALETTAARATLLVLSEMAYPGWQVKVDGRPAQWLRVNYLLRGVALPPGQHRVEFYYRPWSFRLGAVVSGLTILLLLLGGLRWQLTRRPGQRTPTE
jgi:uncharacterized membrane protein YfhO